MLREYQSKFATALMEPAPLSGRRAIYQANVMNALTRVLGAAYPQCRVHVGAARFDSMAGTFIRQNPPRAPQLFAYGDGLATYLDRAADFADEPHVADLARLEWARVEAYFSADAVPLAAEVLAEVAEDRYPTLRFRLHPATRLVAACHPVHRLWDNPTEPADLTGAGQTLLVVRPGYEVSHVVLSRGDAALVGALVEGETLGRAAERAVAEDPALDLRNVLFDHLQRGTFQAVSEGAP
jgi:hypothetical protein